ncbi:MAG: single-stranded-DNA-specific exonuclease RecJ [Eubacteriales bacterium]|nr:single-stranded-DNA-specific exonuclease RecJ [Eubacteriales bacterium]
MLQFIRRGTSVSQPIGDLPMWLSTLLRNRGVDTQEKAERFLHPSLEHLNDPMLMQGMDKAVRLIRRAAEEKTPIIVYGDYDVDGVCATSILLETLRDMGAKADFRIPSRHGEGYGLNCDAVRAMAEEYRLLITVDCGVTNHEEVKLAQLLGMTVIVTDHHQLADTPSPADVVLNPLLGDYPFRRLCGAGVALKLTQVLEGMDAVRKRIDLAALATVADLVPLIEENRVIVQAGLAAMADSPRPGMRALLAVSGVTPPVNAGQVAFRLAPRLNAGGRLEDASQGVSLLTTRDEEQAQQLAAHLEERNQQRQAIEQEITQAAIAAIPESVDFYDDRVIIIAGEGWNHGVIGLAAGRICERYHFPTIVLTKQDGIAVGSCRSIPGVNIHAMLSNCRDLFIRFGGHEQAAGLTMEEKLIPELRRRLNLAIRENCDPACFIPAKEYDLALPLSQVNLELIDKMDLLQPTGYGNPAPVFLLRDGQVQLMRRVGKSRQHLKLSLLDGDSVRDGIAFSMGDLAESGMERVDAVFSPERNEFMGRVTAQLQVQAMRPAEGTAPLPDGETLFRGLLQEITLLAANPIQIPQNLPVTTSAAVRRLMKDGRGVLLICHERERAAAFALDGTADTACGHVRDERAFNTVLCAPDVARLTDVWQEIVLVDGDLLPGEAAAIAEKCPRARLSQLRPNGAVAALMQSLAMDDETLRRLYRRLRMPDAPTLRKLETDTGLTREQVLTGLTAFSQVKLVELSLSPYALRLLPPVKCRMDDSPLVRYLRGMNQTK